MKNPTRSRWAALALLLGLAGCVPIDVEDLATAECAAAADCQAGATCIEGACVACGAERCDGIDNDCDGTSDEDFDLQTDLNHCGACNATCDGTCTAGACAVPDCVPEAETCNGADDDCDEATDEGVLNACGVCGEVPAETCDATDEDCDGKTDEGVLNACGRCGEVPAEVCNGADDDCDGTTDEGVLNACGRCGAAPAERCNDLDDDCDGNADEDFADKGTACTEGLGLCAAAAEYACSADQSGLICPVETAAEPAEELCGTALDEDCDGQTDEGFDLGEACSEGVGTCAVEGVRVCSPDARSAVCDVVPGMPSEEACNTLDDDCDGAVDETYDLLGDLENCGTCGTICAVPNGTPVCSGGACAVEICDAGHEDVDLDPENGCECQPGVYDAPDPLGLDANCDGVDGTAANSVFVSATGGSAAGAGTADDPVTTLAAALALVTPTRNDILLSAEDHPLARLVEISGDVRIFGGYRHDPRAAEGDRWARDLSVRAPRSRIVRTDGGTPALGVDDGASVILTSLDVDLEAAAFADASRVGIYARGCRSLDLNDVVVRVPQASAGGDGRPGLDARDTAAAGSPALDAEPGLAGENAACLEANGGDGGRALPGLLFGGDGLDARGGTLGGLGATTRGEDAAFSGADGLAGSGGRPAVANASGFTVLPPSYAIGLATFSNASDGEPGLGGGGGGATYTFGGGGGGSGGCAGGAARNGEAGGLSVALVVGGACRVSVVGGRFDVGGGGQGGAAGPGGLGGPGASGGLSGSGRLGVDGDGGDGGDGGCGGHGAPGHGGATLGVLRVGPTAQGRLVTDTEYLLGPAGAAGAPVPMENVCGAGPTANQGARLQVGCCAQPAACGLNFVCIGEP